MDSKGKSIYKHVFAIACLEGVKGKIIVFPTEHLEARSVCICVACKEKERAPLDAGLEMNDFFGLAVKYVGCKSRVLFLHLWLCVE